MGAQVAKYFNKESAPRKIPRLLGQTVTKIVSRERRKGWILCCDWQFFKIEKTVKLKREATSMLPNCDLADPDSIFRFRHMVAGTHFHSLVSSKLLATSRFTMDDRENRFEELQDEMYAILPGNPWPGNSGHMHELEKTVEGFGNKGRIDCLLHCAADPEEGGAIVDFKWTRNAKDEDPNPLHGLQLLLYQWLLGKMDDGAAGAEMYLIRYNEVTNTLKRFRFKPPLEYQYSKEKSTQEDFNYAIDSYKERSLEKD